MSAKIKLTEIDVSLVKPNKGLVAFASFVVNESLYCGSVGIFTRPSGSYRLVYPSRVVAGRQINVFHPISTSMGKHIEEEVIRKYEEVVTNGRHRHSSTDTATT